MNKKNLAIVLGTTGNMAFALANVLFGIKNHNPDLNTDIIVFEQEMSSKDKKIINKIFPVTFIKYELPKININKDCFKKFTNMTFSRYECFNMLDEYKKILWLDIDILIQKPLDDLLKECSTGISLASGDKNNKDFLIDMGNLPYFNAGVLYIQDNLPNYNKLTNWCYKKTIEFAPYLNCADQGIINLMIREFGLDVHSLHWTYNFNPAFGGPTEDRVILHTFCQEKFWNYWDFPEWNNNYQQWINLGGSAYQKNKFVHLIKNFLKL